MLLVFQVGNVDLAGAFGTPVAAGLATAATVSVVVAALFSLAGAVISYYGNRTDDRT